MIIQSIWKCSNHIKVNHSSVLFPQSPLNPIHPHIIKFTKSENNSHIFLISWDLIIEISRRKKIKVLDGWILTQQAVWNTCCFYSFNEQFGRIMKKTPTCSLIYLKILAYSTSINITIMTLNHLWTLVVYIYLFRTWTNFLVRAQLKLWFHI